MANGHIQSIIRKAVGKPGTKVSNPKNFKGNPKYNKKSMTFFFMAIFFKEVSIFFLPKV